MMYIVYAIAIVIFATMFPALSLLLGKYVVFATDFWMRLFGVS